MKTLFLALMLLVGLSVIIPAQAATNAVTQTGKHHKKHHKKHHGKMNHSMGKMNNGSGMNHMSKSDSTNH